MAPITLILAGLALCLGVAVVGLLRGQGSRRRAMQAAAIRLDRAVAAEAASTRLLRLSAVELRDSALTLLGHAEKLQDRDCATATAHAGAIAAVTAQVLSLADDLQDNAVGRAETRVIRDQPLAVGPLMQDAVAAVSATLGPGRRHWRIVPELLGMVVVADRRAVSQILLRVLANAARFTRDGDWIDIALERHDDDVCVVIADEGSGLAAMATGPLAAPTDSRGIGLGLALARVLMEAHGGSLTVETAARIGTRVMLTFPARRVTAVTAAVS